MQLETIEMEMKHMKEDMDDIKSTVKEINAKFDNLDDRYTTRREFKSVVWVFWALATMLGVISAVLWFVK